MEHQSDHGAVNMLDALKVKHGISARECAVDLFFHTGRIDKSNVRSFKFHDSTPSGGRLHGIFAGKFLAFLL